MITAMKKYTFLVFHRDYEAFLTELREAGVVHVTQRAAGLVEDADMQALIARRAELQHILKQGAPDQLIQEQADLEQRIAATLKEQARVAIWGDFSSKTIAQLSEAGYTLHYYSCPKSKFDAEWGIQVTENGGLIYFVTVGDNSAVTEDATEITLTKSAAELQADLDGLNGLLAAQKARIEAWALANINQLKDELKSVEQQIDWKEVTLNTESGADGALCILEGFCPVDNTAALDERLNALPAALYYESEDPQPEDATPIKLHNNWFVRLFEPLTGMYGWPNYNEFDPTPILGPFFLLFFSLCIGDAGYGLLLILVGYLIHKGKLKIEMFDGMGPIIMALGVGSTVIGYLMGGFFGINIFQAEWMPSWAKVVMFNNLGEGTTGKFMVAGQPYDVMMVLAILIGVVHICLAMVIKAIAYTKRFGFKENVSTWGWLLLILGGLITAVLAGLELLSPEVTNIVLICIGAISALGIYIFNKPGRNPLINIGAGLWDTYGMATGLLGDVLSYIRLYALGLAGGMLGMAFNQLGAMVLGDTPNVGTWIGFILIVTFGHVLNLLMACLGAFVHPLRLTFVEYFKNSGYEGSGKKYKPFKK
ncbi:MAG: ATPase V [Paludibacteraceae bacterium]|nr:ATPase V [Paludibacteraceae bacterium]